MTFNKSSKTTITMVGVVVIMISNDENKKVHSFLGH